MTKTNDFVMGWNTLGKTMAFYRFLLMAVILLAVVMGVVVAYALDQNPLVVVEKCQDKSFYSAERRAITLSERVVRGFVRSFIKALYEGKELHCMATKGLQARLKQFRQKIKGNASQYVGHIEMDLQENLTLADFDLIMNIDNVPIAVKKSIELQIQKDEGNPCNPLGLYVNGITERGKK